MRLSGNPAWDRFRSVMEARPELQAEFVDAWRSMLEQVNPSDHGPRFVAGAVVEWILAATMYQAGILSPPAGHSARGFDLEVVHKDFKTQFSSKAQFSKKPGAFTISNGRGGDGGGLKFPVIFMSPHIGGIVFVDPSLHPEVKKQELSHKDSVVLPIKAILAHRDTHPECFIPLELPRNEQRGERDAGTELARELLMSSRFPNLRRVFDDSARKEAAGDLLAEVQGFKALRDEGALTEEQFQELVNKVARQSDN